MTMELKSMALEMPEVKGHPNRVAFQGVLTMVDVPSQRPPSGSKGHRVTLTRKAAEAALPSLLGMGVDYSPALDKHDVRCKVGVITRAEIVGRNVELGGYLFARDFPEIVAEVAKSDAIAGPGRLNGARTQYALEAARVRRRPTPSLHAVATSHFEARLPESKNLGLSLRTVAAQLVGLTEALRRDRSSLRNDASTIRAESQIVNGLKGLGMSYEVTNIVLADSRADIWILDKVTFTGAAILRRDKAAYQDTWIELA